MKIAVLGWYGHDNAGDERIKVCLNHFLMGIGGIDTINFYDLHNNAIQGKTHYFNKYNLVIIGGGGIIYSQHNYHDFVMGLEANVLTAGISVETELKGNPKKFAQALIEKSYAVLVRDTHSYERLSALDHNNKVKLSSDLTFLYPYEFRNTSSSLSNILGVNLLARISPFQRGLKLRNFLSRFSDSFSPKVIEFDEITQSLKNAYTILPIPLYCATQNNIQRSYQMNDIQFMEQYFENVASRFDDTDIDKCCAFFSMRLHGLIFALQKGVPFLTLNIYPKQINFCIDTGFKDHVLDMRNMNNLEPKVEHILKNQDDITQKLAVHRSNAIEDIKKQLDIAMNSI